MTAELLPENIPQSIECKLPVFSLDEVAAFLLEHYGMSVSLTPLDGERDLNYLVRRADKSSDLLVFKICNQHESRDLLELQAKVMEEVARSENYKSIESVPSVNHRLIEQIRSRQGIAHFCRLTTYLDGDLFSSVFPRSQRLLQSLGEAVAEFGLLVQDLDPQPLARPLLWHMEHSVDVIDEFCDLVLDNDRRKLIGQVRERFVADVVPRSSQLPRGIIHNDANDNNIVVINQDPWQQSVKGLIDFGDMVCCWRVADLAVACAYGILDQQKPLDTAVEMIKGYHRLQPLNEAEVAVLFPMMMMRLAMSVCICARQKTIEPDNAYLAISERSAWQMLENMSQVSPRYAHFLFRDACDFSPVPCCDEIVAWLTAQKNFEPVCQLPTSASQMLLLDASVSSPHLGSGGDYDVDQMSRELNRALEDAGATAGIGRYDEYRLIYQSDDFSDPSGHQRTLHLGIDVFQPADASVCCPLDGSVYSIADHSDPFDYGGTVIVCHDVLNQDGSKLRFYTLYGHLSPGSTSHLVVGDLVAAGQLIGRMGTPAENGNWPPHLHFQIMTDMLEQDDTFVGVGSHGHREIWLALCPDPNLILRLPQALINQPLSDSVRTADALVDARQRAIPATLSLSYREPLSIARGFGQYLYDFTGRRFLDAVNNVPHVGHCHPHVVAVQRQAAGVLNTNTRYLYRGLGEYAQRLLEKCPKPLSRVFLVNSGSEANDLALRMATCHTGRSEILTLEHGYHGNLGSLIDISGYKHDGPGGKGAPPWVHKVAVPDLYRSTLASTAGGDEFAQPVKWLLEQGDLKKHLAAFISETIPGCGGQLILPKGYLDAVYKMIRQVGGVCIADEVQTGFGRVGTHFWAFETQAVVPDILTLGKPAGNGHPIGAVITTDAIADSFTNGMEYFNTFGGNPVSCAIGQAVLDVIENEALQLNANTSGTHLMQKLQQLSERHALVGDVRGCGLFLGVELVEDRQSQTPAAHQASYIAERMKQEGVLISTDGPWHNVLKIKPPMSFNQWDGDLLSSKLDRILAERWSQPGAFNRLNSL